MKRIVILQILLCAGFASAAVDPNLVGWWKFDEGMETIAYDSAGNNDGNIFGPTWSTGQIDGALNFDGVNDYVEIADNEALRLSSNFTITLWIYRNAYTTTHERFIAKTGTQGGNELDYWFQISSNKLQAGITNTANAGSYLGGSTVIETGKWYFVCSSYDGSDFHLYVNGTLRDEGLTFGPGGNAKQTTKKLEIGRLYNGGAWYYDFNGKMDDIRIYNQLLSAEEIWQLYESGLPELTGLEITGPDEVAENSTAFYKAIAHYEDGTTKDVTALAGWRIEPETIADINGGLLTTGQSLYPTQNIEVYAEYTENLIDVGAQKQVSVIAVCPQGNALSFDGSNDYVSIPDSDILDLKTQATLSAWINTKSLTTPHGIVGRWNYAGGPPYKDSILIEARGDVSRKFRFCIATSDQDSGVTVLASNQQFNANTWYHIAGTYDGVTMKLYINGQLDNSASKTGNIYANNSNWYIGAFNYGNVAYFNGLIDDVRIYNTAMSAEEILAIMLLKPTGSEPNLIAYWDFDEGTGQIANDSSGQGNNGTLGSSSEPDASDPCWVESNAPVGQCTTEQVLGRNLFGAIDDKKAANLLIAEAKAKERASLYLIDELRQSGDVNRPDAFRAKTKICTALFQEEMVSWEIKATMKRLEESLRILDYWIDLNSEP
jgi:hypothetical protein